MYGTVNRVNAQNAKAKLSDSYTKLLREITSSNNSSGSFSIGNYLVTRLIGTGSFGKVYLGVHKFTRTKVVLKSSPKNQPNLVREIHHHRQFKHPHIARLYEIIVTESLVWMVLEYCPGDELYTYLVNHRGQLKNEEIKKIFSELCGAVAYTHSMNCAHRDIKLENVLLDKRHSVKLCDFGFTREYESNRAMLETICGTTCYMAPEMLMGKKYSGEAVDVWSLGIILYTLLYREMPFEEENDLDTKMKVINEEPKYEEQENGRIVLADAKELTKKLLSKDPKMRPSLEEILNHPYLDDFGAIQRHILAIKEPKPFSTKSEKKVLRSLKSANIDLGHLIDSVLSQSCDPLAGFWTLALERQVKTDSKKHRRSSLGIKLPKREDRDRSVGKSGGDANSITNLATSTNNRLKSPSTPGSPRSPLGRFTSSIRSSSEPERNPQQNDNNRVEESDNNTSRVTIPHAPSIPSGLAGLSGLTLSNTSIDKTDQPSISSRSSILDRTKNKATSASRDIRASLKSTMMKLIFVGNLKRRQSLIHPDGTSTTGTTSTTLASTNSTTSQSNLRGLDIHDESGGDITTHSLTGTSGNVTTFVLPNPDIVLDSTATADTGQPQNLSFNSDYYNDTLSTSHSANNSSGRKLSSKVRPVSQISQISQISALSQLSQYSMNSQVSSVPSQLSQEKLNQAFNNNQKGATSKRPKYARRSTSSSISSLISRHRKTHSKASSTSSASLNSAPNSPRRVASPIPGSHSPFQRNHRGRFSEPTIFPSSIRTEDISGGSTARIKLRRKSPFAGISYGRRPSTSSNRKRSSSTKVIEEGEEEEEEEDIYEDIVDDEVTV